MATRYNSAWKAIPKRRPRRGCLSTALAIVVTFAFVITVGWYIWAQITMSNYHDLNSGSKIAQVCAFGTHYPHEISAQVTTFDKNGNPTINSPQTIKGDILRLGGDSITYPFPIVGLSSGYKLTRLEGHYKNPNNESQYGSMSVTINDGDDPFFTIMHALSKSVVATYGASYPVPADGKTYNIFLTSTGGLQASMALGQAGCGPHAKAAH